MQRIPKHVIVAINMLSLFRINENGLTGNPYIEERYMVVEVLVNLGFGVAAFYCL